MGYYYAVALNTILIYYMSVIAAGLHCNLAHSALFPMIDHRS